MAVEGLSEATGGKSEKVEREDPVAAHERKEKERAEARLARSERLGHEIFGEKKETKSRAKSKAKVESSDDSE